MGIVTLDAYQITTRVSDITVELILQRGGNLQTDAKSSGRRVFRPSRATSR
jgi:hypothetical protein